MHRRSRGTRGGRQIGDVVNLKAFFVATLSSALDLGIAVPDDVLRHVTPDVLSVSLPRPLWARLLTACVGAARVDAQLVVETIGVANLCEHVPAPIIWACIEELAMRALGGVVIATPAVSSRPNASSATAPTSRPIPIPLPTPPPPPAEVRTTPSAPIAVGPSIPAPVEADDGRGRLPPSQRFRQSNTGIGRLAATSSRRPQAQAAPAPAPIEPHVEASRTAPLPRVKRGETQSDDNDSETFIGGKDEWKNVDDEQLVDWSAADETVTNGSDFGRKR
jgi:hypothetical protein